MDYPFRTYGRIIQIYRYQVVYIEQEPREVEAETEDGTISEMEMVDVEVMGYFVTEEEAKRTGGTVTALDTAAYEWLDGLEVDDVSDTFAAAVKIYEMGETAYQEMLAAPTEKERVAALEAENTLLNQQVEALSGQLDFQEDCLVEMANIIYA